ncbi:hypothetical protein THAOC_05911 [Thalassiosira oceanica]|uniref:Uncharacterized protein n=1 Tax=Thalassiosira oceanica TaxID=159749 RepID=K0TMA9_THAOC|nr:hypothetical protein THAOC_05911 [Thalassiosira oceanica]|eukprot:EJK72547.1 hypothetical protein THAOC_05911 [Thalassiosira oceanica]
MSEPPTTVSGFKLERCSGPPRGALSIGRLRSAPVPLEEPRQKVFQVTPARDAHGKNSAGRELASCEPHLELSNPFVDRPFLCASPFRLLEPRGKERELQRSTLAASRHSRSRTTPDVGGRL